MKEGLLNIIALYFSKFQDNQEAIMQMLCNTSAPIEISNMVYNFMVKDKELPPIEHLEIQTKQKLWDHAKAVCTNGDKSKVIKLVKCIWLFNSILEK